MKTSRLVWFASLVISLLLALCTGNNLPSASADSGMSAQPGGSAAQLSPTPKPLPSSALALEPTRPPLDPRALTVANIRKVHRLAKWGKGALRETAWSPDGRFFAVATSLGVYVYDAATLKELRFISTGENIFAMAFSPNGHTLATGNQRVRLWSTTTGASKGTLPGRVYGWISKIEFNPSGTILAAVGIDDAPGDPPSRLFVWNATNGQLRYVKDTPVCGQNTGFAFSPNSEDLAYTVCGIVTFLKSSNGTVLSTVGEKLGYHQPIFTPDGKTLVIGSDRIETTTGKVSRSAIPPANGTAVFTPDGKILLQGNMSGDPQDNWETQLWDFTAGKQVLSIPDSGQFGHQSLRPDGAELATIHNHTIQFWNTATGAPTRQIVWDSPVTATTFARVALPEYSMKIALVTGNQQGLVRLLNPSTTDAIKEIQISTGPIRDVAVHPDGNLLGVTFVAGQQIHLLIYNIEKGQVEREISIIRSYNPVGTWGLAFSRDGQAIAVRTSPFMSPEAWNITTGEEIAEPGKIAWFNAADLGAGDNGHLITPGYRQFRDNFTDSPIVTFASRQAVDICDDHVNYVLSYDNRYFALGCDEKAISVWDLLYQKQMPSLKGHRPSILDGWSTDITDLVFSPSGYLLASAGNDRSIRLWNANNSQLLLSIYEHTAPVTDLVFSPDGRYLASTGSDGALVLWGLP